MATSPIYNWPEPDNTDLVKNGALAIRTLGNAIDTTMGTMVAKTIVDAKGDLIAGTAADAAARLAVGNNGETLVADSSTATGLRYQGNYAAGKNKIINGDFRVWQRGTTYSNPKGVYTADRFQYNYDGTGNLTLSQQTFTPGTAPVAGYEGQFFLRVNQTTAGSGGTFNVLQQPIEDVRTFAGQTVTVSFWAKADAARTVNVSLVQTFGTGGSGSVGSGYVDVSVTTSWVRYFVTIAIPSISGKTIGTGDPALRLFFDNPKNATFTVDYWGVQVEAGSVATAFQTATGTIQGELAACRYYYRRTTGDGTALFASMSPTGIAATATDIGYPIVFDTPMRATPTSIEFANLRNSDGLNAPSVNAITIVSVLSTRNVLSLNVTTTAAVVFRPYWLQGNNSTTAFLGWSAEL